MPFTADRAFKADPRMLVRADGMYYWNERGDRLIDSCAGLYTHAAGHCHPAIVAAIEQQARTLDYAMAFQFGHPASFELAARVAALTPGNLNRIFFVNSGSESVDTALKVALQYHKVRGQGQRTRFVGRERGYHGVNFGGTSLGGMVRNKESFGPGLTGVHHMRHTWRADQTFVKGQPPEGADLANDLERFVQSYGADTIAACIVEPIAGSGGVLVPPVGYLQRLREICDTYGILLIFDEVICGFGRTGAPFGSQAFNVTPDIMTMAKALTNGTVPMGAVAFDDRIYETISGAAPDNSVELFHGYTYSGHPLACAAGIASLNVYRDEGLFERANSIADKFLERVFSLKDISAVKDIRGFGMLAAIDVAPDGAAGRRGFELMRRCFENGMVLRVGTDTAVLAPALIANDDHLDEIVGHLRAALKQF
ncbi:MAG TPA: aminotransferase class III-fold pyridoxal phosphate-dependent enzyme [Xanthobacteraceae bacterium]|nr:aminotransferase class III-fold pyridoxal phosphate-dependent enzyme [Xanthobacteraceae bacterium]